MNHLPKHKAKYSDAPLNFNNKIKTMFVPIKEKVTTVEKINSLVYNSLDLTILPYLK